MGTNVLKQSRNQFCCNWSLRQLIFSNRSKLAYETVLNKLLEVKFWLSFWLSFVSDRKHIHCTKAHRILIWYLLCNAQIWRMFLGFWDGDLLLITNRYLLMSAYEPTRPLFRIWWIAAISIGKSSSVELLHHLWNHHAQLSEGHIEIWFQLKQITS